MLAELGGAHGITVHLREDRRHIDDRDVRLLMETVRTVVNLELAANSEMVEIACSLAPVQATLVPEKREEVTTEGGLDLESGATRDALETALGNLTEAGIRTSLFIDPDDHAIEVAAALGAHAVELHTGEYANASGDARGRQLERLAAAGGKAHDAGLHVHAGHGLTYENVTPVAALPRLEELNIGHSIVSRAVLVGMERAVREMLDLMRQAPTMVRDPGRWLPPLGY